MDRSTTSSTRSSTRLRAKVADGKTEITVTKTPDRRRFRYLVYPQPSQEVLSSKGQTKIASNGLREFTYFPRLPIVSSLSF
jgi:hypothetical protein